MSDFDTRPKGTVMYGAFDTFAPAERALRVLQNAGYARAAFEGVDVEEPSSDEPAMIVVDAAATGAARAAEILAEFGARIRYAEHMPEAIELENVQARPDQLAIVQAPAPSVAQAERKLRVRKRAHIDTPRASVQLPNAPVEREDVVIVTRSTQSLAIEG